MHSEECFTAPRGAPGGGSRRRGGRAGRPTRYRRISESLCRGARSSSSRAPACSALPSGPQRQIKATHYGSFLDCYWKECQGYWLASASKIERGWAAVVEETRKKGGKYVPSLIEAISRHGDPSTARGRRYFKEVRRRLKIKRRERLTVLRCFAVSTGRGSSASPFSLNLKFR